MGSGMQQHVRSVALRGDGDAGRSCGVTRRGGGSANGADAELVENGQRVEQALEAPVEDVVVCD